MPATDIAVPEVALLVETDNSWGRSVVRGVADYAQNYGPWNLLIEPREPSQDWSFPESWRVDGVIARISTPLLLNQIRARQVPVVDLGDIFVGEQGVDSVLTDEAKRSEFALEHFRSKGFQHFAYYAPPSRDYSRRRGREYVEAVEQSGAVCSQYRPGYRVGRRISREEHRHRVGRWLSQLPLPVAVLAVDAQRGKELVEVCTQENLRIPDQVAILAGETDDLCCEVCFPPLSSIETASGRIGALAAARLADRLRGEQALDQPIAVPPVGVIGRQSTDILAIEDPMIVRALRFMHAHACRGIVVDDVLAEVPVTRRQLERQFKRNLGRLPAEELRRIRLERGRQLLSETDLSIEEVAEACGYSGATQFGSAFRKQYESTPLSFRKKLS